MVLSNSSLSPGLSAFGAITDNYFVPEMTGVTADKNNGKLYCTVFTVNSLGLIQLWKFTFNCDKGYDSTIKALKSPKEQLANLSGKDLEKAIGAMLDNLPLRKRFRIFFNNEYYPALIPVRDQMVMLHQVIEALLKRGVLNEQDKQIIEITERLCPDWFTT